MTYYKKIFSSFKDIKYLIYSYLSIIIITFIFALYDMNNLKYYITNYISIFTIIINTILILYIIKKNKITIKKTKVLRLFPYIYLCLSFTITFNMLVLYFTKETYVNNINIIILIISSGIIGPIIEELIFRKLIIDKLIKYNSKIKTILLTSIIFSIIHMDIIKMIYAFIIGLIYGNIYLKRKNILEPIILHTISNTIVLLIKSFNTSILIISIISIIFSIYLIYEDNNRVNK